MSKLSSISCPPIQTKCNLANINYTPELTFGPECWYSEPDNKSWSCHFLEDLGLIDCPVGYKDVTSCNYINSDKKVEKECPRKGDKCLLDGKHKVDFDDPFAPLCWHKVKKGGWNCIIKPDHIKLCPEKYTTISNCPKFSHEGNKETLRCPTLKDTCYENDDIPTKINSLGGAKCWRPLVSGWTCIQKPDNEDCPQGMLDVNLCPGSQFQTSKKSKFHKKSLHKEMDNNYRLLRYLDKNCPNLNATCSFLDLNYTLSEMDGPPCWTKQNNTYQCQFPGILSKSTCPKSSIDITQCRNYLKLFPASNQRCPPKGSRCQYMQTSLVLSTTAPECWELNTTGNYRCSYKTELPNQECQNLDISFCPII